MIPTPLLPCPPLHGSDCAREASIRARQLLGGQCPLPGYAAFEPSLRFAAIAGTTPVTASLFDLISGDAHGNNLPQNRSGHQLERVERREEASSHDPRDAREGQGQARLAVPRAVAVGYPPSSSRGKVTTQWHTRGSVQGTGAICPLAISSDPPRNFPCPAFVRPLPCHTLPT